MKDTVTVFIMLIDGNVEVEVYSNPLDADKILRKYIIQFQNENHLTFETMGFNHYKSHDDSVELRLEIQKIRKG